MKVLAFIFTAVICLSAGASLKFSDAIIYIPLKGASLTAGYAVITNDGDENVTLSLKSVPGFKAVETHQTLEKDGRAAMRKVESFIVPARGRLKLIPGGNHIMLFDPLREFKLNELVDAEFIVNEKAQKIKMKIVARPIK